jgi:hypothetical protein
MLCDMLALLASLWEGEGESEVAASNCDCRAREGDSTDYFA